MEFLEKLVLLVSLVVLVMWDPVDRRAVVELRESKDTAVTWENEADLVKWVRKESWEFVAQLDRRGPRAILDHRGLWD